MKQNNNHRTEEEYYIESKRLRAEVMQIADTLKNSFGSNEKLHIEKQAEPSVSKLQEKTGIRVEI